MSVNRYRAEDLVTLSCQLFQAAGLPVDRAEVVAKVFVEADLLGFSTHGLNRIPSNLQWLEDGDTQATVDPEVLVDRGAVVNWDAKYLPGPYVVSKAVDLLCERAKQFGMATMTIRRSQHIACLASYLQQATDRGLVIQMLASTPGDRCVSAFGGCEPIFSPNPFAFGVPTEGDPLLIDLSLSIVAEGYVARAQRSGEPMRSACLKDNQGNVSDNPNDYWAQPRGSIMPIGGLDHGYKGYGLCLWSELMTMALGNYGRADEPSFSEANSVFIQVIDPEVFSSLEAFKREAQYLTELCRHSRVKAGDPPVRVPGDRAMQLRGKQLKYGVEIYPQVLEDIQPWLEKYQVSMPEPI